MDLGYLLMLFAALGIMLSAAFGGDALFRFALGVFLFGFVIQGKVPVGR